MKPLVAVVADTREYDRYVWHMSPAQYLEAAVKVADVTPVIVPAIGDALDFDGLLAQVSGVMLTGSKTNVHPTLYGEQPSVSHEPYDLARDQTSLPLARLAIAQGVPLFAICRGIQELNVALGGRLATEIQNDEDRMDHRAPESENSDERFKLAHSVTQTHNGCLHSILGNEPIMVNSLHRQAISSLAPRLAIEATADDGTIEAVSVVDASSFAVGVQWHPEYWAHCDASSRALFEAFGEAVRAHAKQRMAHDQNASSDIVK